MSKQGEDGMEQQTILVVDDNKEIVFSLGKLLEYEDRKSTRLNSSHA